MAHHLNKLVTMKDISEALGGRHRSSIYRDVKAGRIPRPIKVGRRVYWKADEVNAAITNMEQHN